MNQQKIKVALMADTIDRRPEQTFFARRLAEYLLSRADIELTLIHYEKMPDDPLYSHAREIIIPAVTFPMRSRFLSYLRFALSTKERFDIVHWLVGRVHPFFWLMRAKTVVTTHDGGAVLAPGIFSATRFMYNMSIRLGQAQIARVIGSSRFGAAQIGEAYHLRTEKTAAIYLSVDAYMTPRNASECSSVLNLHGLSYKKYILYVGGMQTHKNVPVLISAYSAYRKSGHSEKLVLIGNPSYGAKEVFEAVARSGYAKDIIFIRHISNQELPFFYSGALMYVHPSQNEGFGMTPLEALACGTPVISSNATALPEVLGNAALFFDPQNAQACASLMQKVAEDTHLRADMITRGFARVKDFSWEKMGNEYVMLYRNVLGI